jgi:hypothetical protein
MSKHTPGPWHYEPGDVGDDSVGIGPTAPYIYADPENDGNVVPICTMDTPARPTGQPPRDEYDECIESIGDERANARLIAAAPEMYEALQWLLKHDPDGDGGMPDYKELRHICDAARAAIAKAEGTR